VQLIGMAAIFLFLRDFYVPATGIIGTRIWFAGCFLLALWMDGARALISFSRALSKSAMA
jgi:hypothetical protein